jgi:hypothetical protein
MKTTHFKACFLHRRLWNPSLLKWENMFHAISAYEGHLKASKCDRCEERHEKEQMAQSTKQPAR